MRMPKEIRIEAVLNGWVVVVGCQRVVFTDMETMLAELQLYLVNPEVASDKYQRHAVNSKFFNLSDEVVAEPRTEQSEPHPQESYMGLRTPEA